MLIHRVENVRSAQRCHAKRIVVAFILGLYSALLALAPSRSSAAEVIQPKVLIFATYGPEFSPWVDGEHLDKAIVVPGVPHPIRTNGHGVYAMLCGTTSQSAVTIMALAMDRRFDLRHTYIILSGIAGGDPTRVSLGSAVWVRHVVDGDPGYEIDSRETPATWPYGVVAFGATAPNRPAPPGSTGIGGDSYLAINVLPDSNPVQFVFNVNPALLNWAYGLTKDLVLPNSTAMVTYASLFPRVEGRGGASVAGTPKPRVAIGDSLGGDRFWHGRIMTRWAEDWVRNYTRGEGVFSVSDSEDQGVFLAIGALQRLGHVDAKRFLILRTISDYTEPPPGTSAAKHLFDGEPRSPAEASALESDYRVGSVVVDALLRTWKSSVNVVP
jgi:purine nucleoside permease